jgi:hypothetical protein
MTTYSVNQAGVAKARKMIDAGQYDVDTEWGDGAPTAEEGNAQIERHGYDGFGEWHLALDDEASDETKDRFGFPFGDFRRVFRSALIHAKARAAQNDHSSIAEAADDLLARLDTKRA